jgi:ribosomal protein S27E
MIEYKKRSVRMNIKCFLCGDDQAKMSDYIDNTASYYVKCPQCGEYKITEMARIEISNGIYRREAFPIVAGEVFDTWYCKKEVKTVKSDDFRTIRTITTPEKLYRLAKYIFTVECGNKEDGPKQDITCRPASCYARDSEEWYWLLDGLKSLYVVDVNETSDSPTDRKRRRMIWSIKMTLNGKIAFEKGINSSKEFERIFMKTDRNDDVNIAITADQVQFGGSQNTMTKIVSTTTNTADIIREKLKERGVSEQQIKEIEPQIAEIASECDKEMVNHGKLRAIISGVGTAIRDIFTQVISQIITNKIAG